MDSYLERIVPKFCKSEANTSLTPLPELPSSAACYLSCLSGAFLSFFSCTFYALRMNSSIPSAWNRVLHQFCHIKYLMLVFLFCIFFYYLGHILLCINAYRNYDSVSACSFSHVHPCSPNRVLLFLLSMLFS